MKKKIWKRLMKSVICLGLIATMVVSPLAGTGMEVKAAPTTGIDVSVYQGDINWSAVKASGVSFAFIRVGTTKKGIDAKFAQNITGANAVGIRTGIYIYSYATTVEAAAYEANLVLQAVAPYTVSFPIAIDIEDSVQKACTPEQLAMIANTFCSIIQSAGYYPMVYGSKNWLTTRIAPVPYDKWVAQYAAACEYPNPAIWQYTSSGSVSGINGRVDMDILYKDYHSLIPAAGFVKRNDKTYYYNNYRMQMGWATIEGARYFFNPAGEMQTGWISNGTTTFYFNPDGKMQVGFSDIQGKRYYFDDNGLMQRGLVTIGAKKYYFDINGVMQTGWLDTGVARFFFNPDGSMVTGWSDINGKRYYFTETGQAAVGLTKIGDATYMFDADGSMKTGWVGNGQIEYYFLTDGKMATGWQNIDGSIYYFKPDGTMNIGLMVLEGQKYYNDIDGKLVTGWKNISEQWFYFAPNGIMVTNTVLPINGYPCQFDENGIFLNAPEGFVGQ